MFGPVLQSQAMQFSQQLNFSIANELKCSNGWLQRWKKRHEVSISGESRSADVTVTEEFLPHFQQLVEKEARLQHGTAVQCRRDSTLLSNDARQNTHL